MASLHQYPKDFFAINKKLLSFIGIWSTTEGMMYKLCNGFRVIMYTLFFCSEIGKLIEFNSSAEILLMVLGTVIVHTGGFVKIYTFLSNKSKIISILDTLESNKFKYQPFGNFDPISEVQRAYKNVRLVCIVFLSVTMNTFLLNYISSLKKYYFTSSDEFVSRGGTIKCEDILAFNAKFPFEMDNKINCGIFLILQAPPIVLFNIEVVGLDIFFLTIVYKIAIHYILLQGVLKTMKGKCLKELNVLQKGRTTNKFLARKRMQFYMKKYTKHLQLLTRLTFEIRDICCYVNLNVVLGNILAVAALLCNSLSGSSDIRGNTKFYFFLISLITQVALYTIPANLLTNSCDEISTALYFCDWLDEDVSFKKNLIINMARFQKPLHLTIGKFSPLTISTFVSVLRASYSFYAVFSKSSA